eukprot:2417853-Amphidinium_carterae.1
MLLQKVLLFYTSPLKLTHVDMDRHTITNRPIHPSRDTTAVQLREDVDDGSMNVRANQQEKKFAELHGGTTGKIAALAAGEQMHTLGERGVTTGVPQQAEEMSAEDDDDELDEGQPLSSILSG